MKIYDDRKLIYSKNGYFNARDIIRSGYNFIFITGARGTGKTYSTLKYLIENSIPFIYLRRTQNESDLQANPTTSSLTKILMASKVDYDFKKLSGKVGVILVNEKPLIYTCALSTFSTIRGIDFLGVEVAVYDEFIPEAHVRSFKAEGMALNNFYESVNRNRELEGNPALKLIGLSNSLNIANDVFMTFNLVIPAELLTNDPVNEIYTEGDKMLILMKDSPISKKKKETMLYKNASDEYNAMAIDNKFILNDFTYVKKQNLKEYKILMQIGDLFIYKHKSNHYYYVTFVKAETKKIYTSSTADRERFRRAEWRYYVRYLDGYVYFDSYNALSLFEKYFDKR